VRRSAAYLRVSTPQQSEAMQRDAIERAASARGASVDQWFTETRARDAYQRPQLDSLRLAARRGELGHVWLFALDRLTGIGAQDMLQLVNELRRHGCTIVSVTEPIDFDGPMGEMMVAWLGCLARWELNRIRERTAAAKKKAESQGKRWGRPPAGSKDQRATLRQLMETPGMTLRKAAKTAGISYGSAQRILSSERQPKRTG
jgi:DNA invertase Pin-like site-specific DNA recombinase